MHDLPTAILRAADARAQGLSWAAAANEAGWNLPGLRSWIRAHRSLWARELGRARRETHDAACDEAVTMLRRQLRAQTEKTILTAATALAARLAPNKSKPANPKPAEMDPAQESALANHLEQLLEAMGPDDPDP
jgi:hypothetical protein